MNTTTRSSRPILMLSWQHGGDSTPRTSRTCDPIDYSLHQQLELCLTPASLSSRFMGSHLEAWGTLSMRQVLITEILRSGLPLTHNPSNPRPFNQHRPQSRFGDVERSGTENFKMKLPMYLKSWSNKSIETE